MIQFEGHVLACKDASSVPGWLNQGCAISPPQPHHHHHSRCRHLTLLAFRSMFYLASLCCLTVPYRIAFAKLCWEVPCVNSFN